MNDTSNVSDATRLQVAKEYRELERQQRQIGGKKTQLLQRAKTLGINVKAMKRAIAARDVDPEEVYAEIREFAAFAALFNFPLSEAGISLDGGDRQHDAKLDQDVADWEAEDAGFLAGESGGRTIDDNPYNGAPGTPLFVAWRRGWTKGQEAIAYRLGGEDKAANAERRPRVARANAAAKAKGAEAPTEGAPAGEQG